MAELIVDIKTVHKANLGVCGARKVHAELNRSGVSVARCTVERLMRQEGIAGIRRNKARRATFSEGAETERPLDLVERGFVTTAPNQLWVADLTYIRTHAGWVYAAFVIDVFKRRVVGCADLDEYAHRSRPQRPRHGPLATAAHRTGRHRLIHHSDRGVQYRAIRYTERLAEADAVAEYVDWFNHRRLHGEIGMVPPAEAEAAYWASQPPVEYAREHVPAGAGTD